MNGSFKASQIDSQAMIKIMILLPIVLVLWVMSSPLMAQQHAIILQYHHIAENTPFITTTKPELFLWQMDYLQREGYRILPLSAVVEAFKSGEQLPQKTVVITFDDAYKSIYKNAFPILKEKMFPFSFFINTKSVGRGENHLNWQQILEMENSGAEILNHSFSHTHLNRIKRGETNQQWKQRVRQDIETAQDTITHFTGSTQKIIAFPYGEYSLQLIELIREMGYSGVGQQSGPAASEFSLEALPRFPMGGNYGKPSVFIEKLNTLPMPLEKAPIVEPLVIDEKPKLRLQFKTSGKINLNNLNCYVSGQGKAKIDLISNQAVVQAVQPLSTGRNRYNCTMPAYKNEDSKTMFYWFSQLWLVPDKNGNWYKEYQ